MIRALIYALISMLFGNLFLNSEPIDYSFLVIQVITLTVSIYHLIMAYFNEHK